MLGTGKMISRLFFISYGLLHYFKVKAQIIKHKIHFIKAWLLQWSYLFCIFWILEYFLLHPMNDSHLFKNSKLTCTFYPVFLLFTLSSLTLGLFAIRADLTVEMFSKDKACSGYSVKAEDLFRHVNLVHLT